MENLAPQLSCKERNACLEKWRSCVVGKASRREESCTNKSTKAAAQALR